MHLFLELALGILSPGNGPLLLRHLSCELVGLLLKFGGLLLGSLTGRLLLFEVLLQSGKLAVEATFLLRESRTVCV